MLEFLKQIDSRLLLWLNGMHSCFGEMGMAASLCCDHWYHYMEVPVEVFVDPAGCNHIDHIERPNGQFL